MVPLLVKRYLWLVDTLRRSSDKGLTLAEINNAWCNPYNQLYKDCGCEELSRRTLLNHRHAIEEQLGIDIECVRAGALSKYIINTEFQENNPVVEWLLSAVSIENLVAEYSRISGKILLEPADKGALHLGVITEALKHNQQIVIDYQSYHIGKETQQNIVVNPLALKMFKRRWYILCHKIDGGGNRLYALDRILKCTSTGIVFDYPKEFVAKEYFRDFYGVSTDGYTENPCYIILRAYRELPRYLISQPLHHSQEIVKQIEEYTEFSYCMRPSFDFVQEILSHGNQLEVVSPESLRSRIKNIVKAQSKLYE